MGKGRGQISRRGGKVAQKPMWGPTLESGSKKVDGRQKSCRTQHRRNVAKAQKGRRQGRANSWATHFPEKKEGFHREPEEERGATKFEDRSLIKKKNEKGKRDRRNGFSKIHEGATKEGDEEEVGSQK